MSSEADQRVIAWIDSLDSESVFLSVITIGELRKGIEKLPNSKRKSMIGTWLQEDLHVRFRDHILPLDIPVILTWGMLVASMEKQGNPLPAIDSLLAATAAQSGFNLASRNIDHFKPAGISLIDPWAAQVDG